MPRKKFTVRWYEQYELVETAATPEEAIEKAKQHLNKGENIDTFDFTATPDDQ